MGNTSTSLTTLNLRKMSHKLGSDSLVTYYLKGYQPSNSKNLDLSPENKIEIELNNFVGQKLTLKFLNQINCVACGRQVNKSFNQGYCFPCMQKLAECDVCIIKPELCHYDRGTCRDASYGDEHCNITHSLYISLTSSAKIGVTRQYQELVRWVDQGAVQALRLISLKRRYHAGLLEVELAREMPDKTNWRKMLKNEVDSIDLPELKIELLDKIFSLIKNTDLNSELAYILDDHKVLEEKNLALVSIKYPVLEYPKKLTSFNLDKDPLVEGTLMGIKGQYLLFDTGVINLRKYAGYLIEVSI
jgi:hypothetical protein